MIRLTKIDGTTVTFCECDICGGRMYSVHQGVVLQPHGGPAKHVHRGKCNEIATQSYGWLQTRTALESHISDIAALLRHVPCELEESTELSPAKAWQQLMATAWADHTPDDQRLLLEQAASAIQQLMRRCVHLAQAVERAEAA